MTNASEDFLIDSNILIYIHDPHDHAKQATCHLLLKELIQAQRAVISTQCLSEFYNVVTRQLPNRMSRSDAYTQVIEFSLACRTIDLTESVLLEGCRVAAQYQLSVWDALIWSAAKLNQVPYIVTEDSAHNRTLEGIRYLNPFSDAFDLQAFLS